MLERHAVKIQKEQLTESTSIHTNLAQPRPFVKWAGGKTQALEWLDRYFPESYRTYYEPFLGGGAAFFHLAQVRSRFKAVLSDANEELMIAYKVIRDHVEELIDLLMNHETMYRLGPEGYYYKIRAEKPTSQVEIASRLIFLNKTCFNGLHRVNRKGAFNVPFGQYKNPKICDKDNLRAVNRVLRSTNPELLRVDYQESTKNAEARDFVYLDPPYQPVSSTAGFTSYTNSGFTLEEQRRLGKWFRELSNRGCAVLLSNSDTKEVLEIYKGYYIQRIPALRAINCKGHQRKGHTELIISNRKEGRCFI